MKTNLQRISNNIILVLIALLFTVSSQAQRPVPASDVHPPFDFSNTMYADQGVNPKAIISRRNGMDGLSVFDKISDPKFNNIRVLVTVPAYTENGEMMFWYPLGEILESGFMENKAGAVAKQRATLFPIYVFPDPRMMSFNIFAGTRQAPIIDNSWNMYTGRELNAIGLRQVLIVNYTDKAFTKEGYEMMKYMGGKNGMAADDTPLIKSKYDIDELLKSELINIDKINIATGPSRKGQFAIGPMIPDPTKGVIAPDAFLWMATKDGTALPGEEMFVMQFNCLQKLGNWCSK